MPRVDRRRIDAVDEVSRERAQSFLNQENQQRILQSFQAFAAKDGFSAVATREQIVANGASLSIPLYVKRSTATGRSNSDNELVSLGSAWQQWQTDGRAFWQQMDALVGTLDGLETEEIERG